MQTSSLCHLAATEVGVDLQTVSRALGHESSATTSRIYLHAVDALQVDATARIDNLIGRAVGDAMDAPPDTSKRPVKDSSGPLRAHPTALGKEKARNYRLNLVAPRGVEPLSPP